MGLNFMMCIYSSTEADPSWSYGGFGRFREKIADSIGIKLSDMQGFGGETPWKNPKEDPIIYLLDHSDCDGILTLYQMESLIPRLREIIDSWEFTEKQNEDLGYDFRMGKNLIEAMEECVRESADLIFC